MTNFNQPPQAPEIDTSELDKSGLMSKDKNKKLTPEELNKKYNVTQDKSHDSFNPVQYTLIVDPALKLDEAIDRKSVEFKGASVETMAKDLVFSFWEARAKELQDDIKKSQGRFSNYYSVAEIIAYLENIKAGIFFEPVHVSGVYRDKPKNIIIESVYESLKNSLDSNALYLKGLGNSPSDSQDYIEKVRGETDKYLKALMLLDRLKAMKV